MRSILRLRRLATIAKTCAQSLVRSSARLRRARSRPSKSLAIGSTVDQLIFFARISGANDGPDSFFLVPSVVPGPVAGAGLPGLMLAFGMAGLFLRRKLIG